MIHHHLANFFPITEEANPSNPNNIHLKLYLLLEKTVTFPSLSCAFSWGVSFRLESSQSNGELILAGKLTMILGWYLIKSYQANMSSIKVCIHILSIHENNLYTVYHLYII